MANRNQKNNPSTTKGRHVNSSKEREARGRKPYKAPASPGKREIVYEKSTGSLVPLKGA